MLLCFSTTFPGYVRCQQAERVVPANCSCPFCCGNELCDVCLLTNFRCRLYALVRADAVYSHHQQCPWEGGHIATPANSPNGSEKDVLLAVREGKRTANSRDRCVDFKTCVHTYILISFSCPSSVAPSSSSHVLCLTCCFVLQQTPIVHPRHQRSSLKCMVLVQSVWKIAAAARPCCVALPSPPVILVARLCVCVYVIELVMPSLYPCFCLRHRQFFVAGVM